MHRYGLGALCALVVSIGLGCNGSGSGPVIQAADLALPAVDGEGTYDRIGQYTLTFSPDGKRMAFAARQGDKWAMIIDGRAGKPFDAVGLPHFSPNGRRLAYAARVGEREIVVCDETGGPSFERIVAGSITFSPDSEHLAYAGVRDSKQQVVLNGWPQEPFDDVDELSFSPDSRRLAYRAAAQDRWRIVVESLPELPSPLPSRDEPAEADDPPPDLDEALIYEGLGVRRVSQSYDIISPPLFSDDGNHIAYVARHNNKELVVLDGNPGDEYDRVFIDSLVFSIDSNHLAYAAVRVNKQLVVLDQRPGLLYDQVGRPYFSNNSCWLAYRARRENKWEMVVHPTGPGLCPCPAAGGAPPFRPAARHRLGNLMALAPI